MAPEQAAADTTQLTGWPRVELFDNRDKYYVPVRYFNLKELSPLNLRTHKDYNKHFLPFYNQSPANSKKPAVWGTCVANAAAAAFAYEWNRQGLQPPMHPSRLFIYFNARMMGWEKTKAVWSDPLNQDPKQQGTFIRLACKVMEKLGVCGESDWKYDDERFATQPSPDAIKNALLNRTVQYSRLDPDQPEGVEKHMSSEEKDIIGAMTLLRLRQCLGEGYPVIFGFRYYWKDAPFTKADAGIWDIGSLPSRNGPSDNFGGHAVLAIGFDDEKKRILCQNSWGESNSGAPLFWMGYEWIKDFEATSDFWMIRLVERTEK